MGYINNDKQRERTWLINNLISVSSELHSIIAKLEENISLADCTISEMPSGNDEVILSNASGAMYSVESAKQLVDSCVELARNLDVEEEEDDDDYGQQGYYDW